MTEYSLGPQIKRLRIRMSDGEMAILRLGDAGSPPLLFAHANGFCASAYRQMLQALAGQYDVFAVDLRGHGATTLPTDRGPYSGFDIFANDLSALLVELSGCIDGQKQWIFSGHSLGAVAVMLASVGRKDVRALRLIEPVALPPFWYAIARTPVWPIISKRTPLVKGALKRRALWTSRESVLEQYRRKKFFAGFAPGVLEDYLTDGLADASEGVMLSCAPKWEAETFGAQGHYFWRAAMAAGAPIKILAVRHETTTVAPTALRRFRQIGATIVMADGVSHLVPFEQPRAAAQFLATS